MASAIVKVQGGPGSVPALLGQGARPFEQIERAITEALPALRTPLVPRNVPWFTPARAGLRESRTGAADHGYLPTRRIGVRAGAFIAFRWSFPRTTDRP